MQHPSGQGLLETVVALGVVSVGLVAAITLATTSFVASGESAARLVATNLAREGIEVTRNIRDTEAMNHRDPAGVFAGAANDHTFVPVLTPGNGSWALNFSPELITDPGAAIRESADGLLLHGAGAATIFRRLLTVALICRSGGTERVVSSGPCDVLETRIGFDVSSLVTWQKGETVRSITVEEKLYDWK